MANDWTVLSLLTTTAAYFKRLGLPTARLDADVLLAAHLGVERLQLYLHTDKPLTAAEVEAFREPVRRRAQREPVAYILGSREFYGLPLEVGPGVLVPRPETELLVERAVALLKAAPEDEPPLLLDLCTGSGAIPIAALSEVPAARGIGADLSPVALSWARRNVERHALGQRLALRQSDLARDVPERFRGRVDVLTCNPPYLTAAELADLAPEVAHEPREALDGGRDGLDLYRRLAQEAPAWLKPGGWLLLEIGAAQGEAVADLLTRGGLAEVAVVPDLARLPRMAVGRRA